MSTVGDLLFKVGAQIDGFQDAMSDVSKAITNVVRDAETQFRGLDKIGDQLTSLGGTLSAALTLPLAGVGVAVTKMAGDFDQGMHKVASLIDDVTENDFKTLSAQVLDMSKALGVDAVKATDALYQALSSGIPKENAVDFLRVASVAAIAGMTDTKVAVDGLTTVIQAFGLKTSDAKDVSDAMFAAVKVGKLEFPELASSIGIAAGMAHTLGISYQELMAATATLTNTTGQKAPEAFTMLESAMKALIEPTKQMQTLLDKTGYSSGTALIAAKGLEGGLQAISAAANGNIEVLTTAFGRIEGLRGTLALTGDNAKRAADDMTTLSHASDGMGAAAAAAAEVNKGFNRQLEAFITDLKDSAIQLGTALLPVIRQLLEDGKPLLDWISGTVKQFGELPASTQEAVIAFAAVAAAIGPIIFVAGEMISAFATVGTAVSALSGVLGIAGLGGVLAATGPLAIALGVAIAGWAIYEAISQIREMQKALNELFDAQNRGVQATQAQALQIASLTNALKSYNDQASLAGKQEIKVPQFDPSAAKPIDDYIAALQKAVAQTGQFGSSADKAKSQLESLKSGGVITLGDAITTLATKTATLPPAVQAVIDKQKQLEAEYQKAKSTYQALVDLQAKGIVSTKAVAAAQAEMQKAYKSANPDIKEAADAEKEHQKALGILSAALTQAQHDLTEAQKAEKLGVATADDVKAAQQRVADLLALMHPDWIQHARDIQAVTPELEAMNVTLKDTVDGEKLLTETFKNAKMPIDDLGEAYKTLGIKTTSSLQQSADAARVAFEKIAGSAIATQPEVDEAFKKMAQAQIDLAKALGDSDLAAEWQRQLDTVATSTKNHVAAQKTVWQQMVLDIHDALGNVSKSIGDLIVNGDFSIDKIGAAFEDAFKHVASDAIAHFINEGLDLLFKNLDTLLAKLPGIGSSIADIFKASTGAAASGASGAASVGSSAAGAGGAASSAITSSLSSTVGMITGAVTAVGTIGTWIESIRQEGTMNAIELNTRLAATFIGDPNGGVLAYLAKILPEAHDLTASFQGWFHDAFAHGLDVAEQTLDLLDKRMMAALGTINDGIAALGQVVAPPSYVSTLSPARASGGPPLNIKIFLDGRELTNAIVTYLEESGTTT